MDLIKSYGPAIADEAAAIAVEEISGPLLMLASKDDHMWPSVESVSSSIAQSYTSRQAI